MAIATKPRSFRPSAKNQERLEFAEKLEINVTDVINEALEKYGRTIIEGKVKKLREALNVPIP